MKSNWIDKLHKEEVIILDELDRIAKKNKLNYFLTGGTLIGAVRHKGFIPWDDDIDLGMTRRDFNKLIECCKRDLSKDFILDVYPISKKNRFLYAKIRLNNTLLIEESIKDLNANHGIWIDIFPYDNIEEINSQEHLKKNNYRTYMTKLTCRQMGLKNYLSEYKKDHKIIMFFVDIMLKIIPKGYLLKLANKKISSNENDNSKYISNMTGGLSLEKETHLRKDVFPTIKLEFEGKKYPCPKEFDKLLTKIYGDYMKLPPMEKRVTHNPVKIKFRDGEEIVFESEEK